MMGMFKKSTAVYHHNKLLVLTQLVVLDLPGHSTIREWWVPLRSNGNYPIESTLAYIVKERTQFSIHTPPHLPSKAQIIYSGTKYPKSSIHV
jgi:hypothetical protein